MIRQIRWRIALPYAILIGLFLAGLGAYLLYSFRERGLQDQKNKMAAEASLLANVLASLGEGFLLEPLEAGSLAEDWSNELGLRVTIIAPDGVVIGDSETNPEEMDNHLDRPEIQQAIAEGFGQSTRFSRTEGKEEIYVAVPVRLGDELAGILRLSIAVDQTQADIAGALRLIVIGTVTAIVLAILLAAILAHSLAMPISSLTRRVRTFTLEGPGNRQPLTGGNEIDELSKAFEDLTQKLSAQDQLLQTERSKLASVLEQLTEGVIIVNRQGQVQLINQVAQRIFGVDGPSANGQSIAGIMRHHQLVDLWKQASQSGENRMILVELPARRLYLHVEAIPLSDTTSRPTLLIFQDVTHVRHLETVRRDFVSNISHELRTPLASLKALTETLQESALDDPPAARRFLTRIETEVDALTLMVQELLELSRIESGKVPLQLSPVPPCDLLTKAVERLRLQAERNGLDVRMECPQNLPLVLADPPRMEQVIVNLLHNAIKFTAAGGRIRLGARCDQDTVIFYVQDSGVGIPREALPRIFERFYKADRSRSGGGTGLGLAISRHLVEAHSGRIWAESTEGKGSTFYFSIPLANGSASPA